ncbi:MAG: phasin [Rhizobiaceae bacterium]
MSKKIESDAFAMPSFDASKMTDQFRDMTEKGVEQTKDAYAKMKTGAEEAQKTVEETLKTVQAAGADVSLKAISTMRTNAEAGLAHLEALVGVKSVSDFVELQTSFFRKQAELVVAQAKELQDVSTKAVEKAAAPAKAAFEKVAKEFKAA